MKKQPKTPELDKLHKVTDESQGIGAFLDWLREQGLTLCKYYVDETYEPCGLPAEKLLADYYKIDLEEVEQERRDLLDWLRDENAERLRKESAKGKVRIKA